MFGRSIGNAANVPDLVESNVHAPRPTKRLVLAHRVPPHQGEEPEFDSLFLSYL